MISCGSLARANVPTTTIEMIHPLFQPFQMSSYLPFQFVGFMFGFKLLLQMFSILTEASSSSSGNKTQDWRPNMMNGGVPVSNQVLSCSFHMSTDATTGLRSTYWIFLPNVFCCVLKSFWRILRHLVRWPNIYMNLKNIDYCVDEFDHLR